MIIGIKDIITLDDDNKYMVISKVDFNNIAYYYLLDVNNNSNIKFCYQDNDELVEVEDKELITNLLPLFSKLIIDNIES